MSEKSKNLCKYLAMGRSFRLNKTPSSDQMRLAVLRAGHGFSGDQRMLSGVLLPYDTQLDGNPPEIYKRGCFVNLHDDLRLSFNFDANFVIGRRGAGTLELWDDFDGLHFEALLPDTSWGKGLAASIGRGDIGGTAITGRALKEHVEVRNGEKCRVIDRAVLFATAIDSFSGFEGGLSITEQQVPGAAAEAYDRNFLGRMGIRGSR